MWPKRMASSANSSDSRIANMSSTCLLSSCTAESPLNRTRLTNLPGASVTIEAPFLKKFANNWPTQALAMQLLKNRQGYSYHCGYLEVLEKYAYLKNKVAKETQDGCDALSGGEEDNARGEAGGSTDRIPSGSKSKHATPVAATTQPQKKQKTSLNVTTTHTPHSASQRQGQAKDN